MAILRRDNSDIYIKNKNDLKREDLIHAIKYPYDNVYIVDDNHEYLGYLNSKIAKAILCGENKDIDRTHYFENTESYYDIDFLFENSPELLRLPIVSSGILIGEYYNNKKEGLDYEIQKCQRAAGLLKHMWKTFRETLYALNADTIGINAQDEIVEIFKSNFDACKIEKWKEGSAYDLVIDFMYNTFLEDLLIKAKCINGDTFLQYILIGEVLNYSLKRKVTLFFIQGPKKDEIKKYAYDDEKKALSNSKNIAVVLNDEKYIKKVLANDSKSYAYLKDKKNGFQNAYAVINNGYCKVLHDCQNEYITITNGKRITHYQPGQYQNEIYLYGPCIVQGLCVIDKHTISSYLQEYIIANGFKYRVNNCGVGDGGDLTNDLLYILSTNFKSGDIGIIINDFPDELIKMVLKSGFNYHNLTNIFLDCHYWFINHPYHCNYKANNMIAHQLYNYLIDLMISKEKVDSDYENNYWVANAIPPIFSDEEIVNSEEFFQYISFLKKHRFKDIENKIGAIVITADPFTLGHYYLINESLKRVEYLYVFLVEDNYGTFSYLDRYNMICRSLKHNNRVKVLPGNIMASIFTFNAYFNKSISIDINPEMHLNMFGKYVSPILNIQYRFFGEEPVDNITNVLNKKAEEVLSSYGLKVLTVKRKKIDGEIISARIVRDLYKKGELEELKKYVTNETYNLIREIYMFELSEKRKPVNASLGI